MKKKYNNLTDSEQAFLKLTALAVETVDLSGFSKILRLCAITSLNGIPLTQKLIQKVAKGLIQKKLIVHETMTKFRIDRSVHRFIFKEALQDERLADFIKAIREVYPLESKSKYSYSNKASRNYQVCLREMQFALANKEVETFENVSSIIRKEYKEYSPIPFFFTDPFEKEFLEILPVKIQAKILKELLTDAIEQLQPIAPIEQFLEDAYATNPKNEAFRKLLGTLFILQGQINNEDIFFENELGNKAWVAFLKGENDRAISLFAEDLKVMKKGTHKKKVFLKHIAAPFYLIALLKTNDPKYHSDIMTYAKNAQYQSERPSMDYLIGLMLHLNNDTMEGSWYLKTIPSNSLDWVFKGIITYWMELKLTKEDLKQIEKRYTLSIENGLMWLTMEYATILSKLHKDKQQVDMYKEKALALQEVLGIESMVYALKKVEDWERVLLAFEGLTSIGTSTSTEIGGNTRIAWLVNFKRHLIQPKLQSRNKKGVWSQGRNIALKRLYSNGEDAITPQDQKIVNTIYAEQSPGYYGGTDYYFNFTNAVKAMVGHPRIFSYTDSSVFLEVTVVKPELIVEEKQNAFEIEFSHQVEADGVSINQETPTRYNLVQVDPIHQEIAKAMGKQKVSIPKKAKKRLSAFLKLMEGKIALHSTLAHSEENLPTKKGDTTIYVHLLPFGEGFKLEMFCKPAGIPPYFKPGKGRVEFVAEIKNKRVLVKRSLKKELEQAKKVEAACSTLQQVESYQGEWTFDDNETCLNILLELEALKKNGSVKLEWPKGEKIRLTHHAGFEQFSMRINKENDWFGISGELIVENQQVLDMRHLLELMDSKDSSRFIEIKDGQFIALTIAFKKKLSAINTFLDRSSGGMKAHNLAVAAMEDFTDLVANLEVDKEWKKQINRLKRARKLEAVVPSTFKATLRPYQLEGYQWLQRLAYWGVGACLADDMGLGKTIQALAVLIDRANSGPALVVAPASVCRNWRKESIHFAPTLNPILFGEGNRKQTIKALKNHDVLITTYGLLHQESKLLSSKKFGTIILDEAQAIKNRTTKRSKAAMNLKGDFKILTTGTPIENHLGELWNLFHFINPGLLGSYDSFQNKYILPVEKDKDKLAQQHLKKLIQPFILRRRKNEVLEDLPSKTEITLSVELSTAEQAFYEALRQTAVDKIAKEQEEKGHFGMQILAEITRLRQACCHPQLVQQDIPIESSKLQLLEEVVTELVENGHKALIFSQFVGHLKIIESLLQKIKVSYQYLDGQTPLKKREMAINAFQSGEGDVFLISLKAGGVGLNLTAADYVIHTDPWWNPAVEDQASDRAHRIGQKRPVTIYRLVTANTIEEKIVALHKHKRDLADSLLAGTERSGRLSSEALLALIQEG